jgi:dynein heavy chain
MQLLIGNGDLTTTWIPFQYFLDTKASKSLVYGPGVLKENLVGHETEFVIIARNELNENRTSGRDTFIVKIKKELPKPADYNEEESGPYKIKYDSQEVPIIDNDDGSYSVKYQVDEESEVQVHVYLMVKEEPAPIRGSPYIASFNSTAKPADNTLAGPLMQANFKQQMNDLADYMSKKHKSIATKGKDLQDVPVLLTIKEEVEDVFNNEGKTTLKIDQLEESSKMFAAAVPKVKVDSSKFGKIVTNWNNVKNNAKGTKKTIAPIVEQQDSVNKSNIKSLEEHIGTFTQEMRKRPFFKYETGAKESIAKLGDVFGELRDFEDSRDLLGENSRKFGNPDLITKTVKDIEAIKATIDNMKALWDHIETCQ